MPRYAAILIISLAANGAWAQQAPAPDATTPAIAAPTAAAKTLVPMEEPRPGDRWVYEVRDEITGSISATRQNVVTEVSPKEIAVRYKNVGTNNEGLSVYDRSWNTVEDGAWRYSPNDGSGIQLPLSVGKTWRIKTNNVNSANGNIWKRSGSSKVIGQEVVSTRAGTFDTFKIETTFTGTNVNNPTLKNDVVAVTWYAPAIDHWVKRTFVSKANNHLQTSTTSELIEYGRRP